MDKYDMEIQAAVNLPSRQTINKQILDLEKKINKLKISGTLDDAAIKKLTDQLKSLKATVTTIDFSPSALQSLTSQVEKALSSVNVSDAGTKKADSFLASFGKQITTKISDYVKNIGKCRISVRIS
jgi:septal ring factor EnvC (AmiA/AmiB activator)